MRFLEDLRYAVRFFHKTLRTEFGTTVVTILTLALAIAANTLVFSVANALLFKRPGVVQPQQLVNIGRVGRVGGLGNISYVDYVDYRDRSTVFSSIAAFSVGDIELGLRIGDSAEHASGVVVTENMFDVLGTTPTLGRFFTGVDHQLGDLPVAIISHSLWTTRFNGDPSVIGKEIVLNGRSVSIIGVAPAQLHGPDFRQIDVWLPVSAWRIARDNDTVDLLRARGGFWLQGIARLKPGVSIERARAELTVITAQLETDYPGMYRNGINILPYFPIPGEQATVQLFVTAVLAIIGLILLIASANVAGIGLARAAARRREIALRFALGAGRARILRQMILETLPVFVIAGITGMIAASWMNEVLYAIKGILPIPVALDLSVDVRLVFFTLGITLIAALVSALTPALSATQTDLSTSLKDDPITATGRRTMLRKGLVLVQISLSLVLLIAGGLFFRTVTQTDLTNPGFDPNHVQVVLLDFFMAGYKDSQGRGVAESLLDRVRALPSVESASFALDLPLDLNAFGLGPINVEGFEPPRGARGFGAEWNIVSPGFFRTLQLPLLRGRDFTDKDRAGSSSVAIINQTMAEKFWPGQDPIGRRFYHGSMSANNLVEIVGVAKDTQNRTVGERPIPFVYVPLSQMFSSRLSLLVRTSGQANVIPALRNLLHQTDSNLPIISIQSMNQVIGLSLLPQRVAAWLVGSMALIGMLLASMGIYGLTAYAVSSRTREIGIRIAIGAHPRGILHLMLREGLWLSAAGVAMGLFGAVAVGQLIRTYLYNISPTDVFAFAGATISLAAAALLATYLPARHATRVDPMVALRHE